MTLRLSMLQPGVVSDVRNAEEDVPLIEGDRLTEAGLIYLQSLSDVEAVPYIADDVLLAALNATVKPESAAPDLSYWGDEAVSKMRASLIAAREAERESR